MKVVRCYSRYKGLSFVAGGEGAGGVGMVRDEDAQGCSGMRMLGGAEGLAFSGVGFSGMGCSGMGCLRMLRDWDSQG